MRGTARARPCASSLAARAKGRCRSPARVRSRSRSGGPLVSSSGRATRRAGTNPATSSFSTTIASPGYRRSPPASPAATGWRARPSAWRSKESSPRSARSISRASSSNLPLVQRLVDSASPSTFAPPPPHLLRPLPRRSGWTAPPAVRSTPRWTPSRASTARGTPTSVAREVKDLVRELERHLGERATWDTATTRVLFDVVAPGRSARRRSPDHERVFWQLAGFCLRPGFGDPMDGARVAAIAPLAPERLSFPDQTRGWQQFFIAWRRIAAGMGEPHQVVLRDLADPWLAPSEARPKKQKGARPLADPEMLDMAASLERVPASRRAELGAWILERTWTDRDPRLWAAIGRIGARVPAYASVHHVIVAHVVERWVDQLLREKWDRDPHRRRGCRPPRARNRRPRPRSVRGPAQERRAPAGGDRCGGGPGSRGHRARRRRRGRARGVLGREPSRSGFASRGAVRDPVARPRSRRSSRRSSPPRARRPTLASSSRTETATFSRPGRPAAGLRSFPMR